MKAFKPSILLYARSFKSASLCYRATSPENLPVAIFLNRAAKRFVLLFVTSSREELDA